MSNLNFQSQILSTWGYLRPLDTDIIIGEPIETVNLELKVEEDVVLQINECEN